MSVETLPDRTARGLGRSAVRCKPLPVREESLKQEEMVHYKGGDGGATDFGIAQEAIKKQQEAEGPAGSMVRQLETYAIFHGANDDSSRTSGNFSIKSLLESISNWWNSSSTSAAQPPAPEAGISQEGVDELGPYCLINGKKVYY